MNRTVFEEIYTKYYNVITGYCQHTASCSKHDAEDIASDAFVLLLEKWNSFTSHEEKVLLSWLYRTATNKIKEYWRKKKNNTIVEPHTLDEILHNLEEQEFSHNIFGEDQDEKYEQYIKKIRSKIPLKNQNLFDCIVIKQLTYEQTSNVLGISINAVKLRWYRLCDKLIPEVEELLKTKICKQIVNN